MQPFRINAVPNGDICKLIISGEADLAAAPDITELGMAALHEPTAVTLHVDLGAVTFMDSTALGALITLRNSADEVGKRVVLDPVPQRVQRLIDLGGLNDLFGTAATTHPREAVAESG